jgi:hypothetical protein
VDIVWVRNKEFTEGRELFRETDVSASGLCGFRKVKNNCSTGQGK